MDENIWDELLSSPYDEGRKSRRTESHEPRDSGAWVPIGLAALVAVGVGVGIGWFFAPDAEPVAATSTTTVPTTTTIPIAEAEFLIGYEPLDETAFAPIAQFQSGGRTYVAIAEIVAPGVDREVVAPEPVAKYQIAADGLQVDAEISFTSVLTPGIRLIEFPVLVGEGTVSMVRGTLPAPIESTHDTALTIAGGESGSPLDGLPLTVDGGIVIDVSGDTFISVDSVEVADDWGTVTWHIEGDDETVARADFFIEYVGVGSETEGGGLATLIPAHLTGPSFGQSQPPSPPGFSKGRTEQLARTGPHITADNPVSALTLRWRIEWSRPTATTATLEPAVIYE